LGFLYDALIFVHILTVVFMSAPLYNLIIVSERAKFGKAPIQVDRYFENLIRGNTSRCYAFQLTALVTGILLLAVGELPLSSMFTNWAILGKTLILLALTGLLSVIHFHIQPSIDEHLSQVAGDVIPPEITGKLLPLRLLRKRMATLCLFLVATAIVLALQIRSPFHPALSLLLIGFIALFAWLVYKRGVPRGWI